jgi:5-methylcytosine-specific restriction endonuclease McrA
MTMDRTAPPSAEAQLIFLTKLQRLFAEGDFTATYKFALLIALADLAVEQGRDDGRELMLTTRQIGERFIHLYWQQAAAYGTGRPGAESGVLVQNTGAQAAVVSAIVAVRQTMPAANPQVAARHPAYPGLLRGVTQTVSAMPLNYLQNFGGETDEFLYERAGPGQILLRPGVAFCLRRFQPLVQQLARSHWIGHLKGNRRNHAILGEADDLERFLFETSRQSLLKLAEGLRRIDGATCFYCGLGLAVPDVDHFIPFSQYPRDLAHNFVLAHPACNRSKSAMLGARRHLERWLERLIRRSDDVAEVGAEAGLVVDAATCQRVALWSYASARAGRASAWVASNTFEVVDASYTTCFNQDLN